MPTKNLSVAMALDFKIILLHFYINNITNNIIFFYKLMIIMI